MINTGVSVVDLVIKGVPVEEVFLRDTGANFIRELMERLTETDEKEESRGSANNG
jgi:hypothetical protein